MKKSISYWSFPGGLEGRADITEAMRIAKDAGFEGIELALSPEGQLSLETSPNDLRLLKAKAAEIGIEISGLATVMYWDYNFSLSDEKGRRKAHEITAKLLASAAALEVDTALCIPGGVDVFFNPRAEVVSYETAYARIKEGVKVSLPLAGKYGVILAIENVWNKFFQSPLELRDFIDSFKSASLGAYFDTGNVMAYGYPEQWIRILGPRIKRVHFKDYRVGLGENGFCDLLEGDVNWPETIRALRDVHYDGYVTAEMIPCYKYAPLTRIYNTSRAMDGILGL